MISIEGRFHVRASVVRYLIFIVVLYCTMEQRNLFICFRPRPTKHFSRIIWYGSRKKNLPTFSFFQLNNLTRQFKTFWKIDAHFTIEIHISSLMSPSPYLVRKVVFYQEILEGGGEGKGGFKNAFLQLQLKQQSQFDC